MQIRSYSACANIAMLHLKTILHFQCIDALEKADTTTICNEIDFGGVQTLRLSVFFMKKGGLPHNCPQMHAFTKCIHRFTVRKILYA